MNHIQQNKTNLQALAEQASWLNLFIAGAGLISQPQCYVSAIIVKLQNDKLLLFVDCFWVAYQMEWGRELLTRGTAPASCIFRPSNV
jgi:hypothetical protein